MRRRNKKLRRICYILISIILLVALIMLLKPKKQIQQLEQTANTKLSKNTVEELEDAKITIEDVYTEIDHLIIEYNVNLTEELKLIETDYYTTQNFKLDRELTIDENKVESQSIKQMTYKIDDKTLRVYDLIDTNKLTLGDIYTLKATIYNTGTTNSKENKKVISEINLNLEKKETDKNAIINLIEGTYQYENLEVSVEKIIKVPSAKFIIVNSKMTGISSNQLNQNDLNNPQKYTISIQDEENNILDVIKNQEIKLTDQEGNIVSAQDNKENVTANITTTLALVDDLRNTINIRILPIIQNETQTLTEEELNTKTWQDIKDGIYYEENQKGGKVEVKNIKIEENTIKIEYTKKGFILENDSVIIIREKEIPGEYMIPKKITKSEKLYTAEFEIQIDQTIEDLEFSLIEGTNYGQLGEGFMI